MIVTGNWTLHIEGVWVSQMVPHISDAMDRPSDIQNRYSQHALYVLYNTKNKQELICNSIDLHLHIGLWVSEWLFGWIDKQAHSMNGIRHEVFRFVVSCSLLSLPKIAAL